MIRQENEMNQPTWKGDNVENMNEREVERVEGELEFHNRGVHK